MALCIKTGCWGENVESKTGPFPVIQCTVFHNGSLAALAYDPIPSDLEFTNLILEDARIAKID